MKKPKEIEYVCFGSIGKIFILSSLLNKINLPTGPPDCLQYLNTDTGTIKRYTLLEMIFSNVKITKQQMYCLNTVLAYIF